MVDLVTLAIVVPLAVSSNPCNFSDILSHASKSEIEIAEVNGITDWDTYNSFIQKNEESSDGDSIKRRVSPGTGNAIRDITDLSEYLNNNYKGYTWTQDKNNSGSTSDITGAIPIEMNHDYFPESDISSALKLSNKNGMSNYEETLVWPSSPTGSSNKGLICLDNISLVREYVS